MDIKLKVTKLVSRAMEDARGLDYKYPNEEDAKDLADTLNGILDHTVKELLIAMNKIGKGCIECGSCDKLISDIKKLKRFDDIPWEEGGNSTREYSSDGGCVDADDLYEVINNYQL